MFWAEIWKISEFLSVNFHVFLLVKISVYLHRRVFVMYVKSHLQMWKFLHLWKYFRRGDWSGIVFYPKYSDVSFSYRTCSEIGKTCRFCCCWFVWKLPQVGNNIDPVLRCLIWVYIVCSDPGWLIRVNRVLFLSFWPRGYKTFFHTQLNWAWTFTWS